jgi:SHO1 osmosensor
MFSPGVHLTDEAKCRLQIIWVLYFTAEEDSLILHTMNSLGAGAGLSPASRSGGNRRRHTHTQSHHSQRTSNGYTGTGKEEHIGMGMGGGMAPINTGGTMGMGPGPGGMGMGRPVSQENARSIGPGTGGGRSIGEDGQRAASPSTPLMSNAVPPGGGGGALGHDPEAGGYAYKARALYAYTASPDDPAEISFAKGEILDIVDNNGKWWQARKEDGSTGSEWFILSLGCCY